MARTMLVCAILLIAAVFVMAADEPVETKKGPIAWWSFDKIESVGNAVIVKDEAGSGLDGKAAGDAIQVEGKVGKALSFEAEKAVVTVPYKDALDIDDATITAWVKFGNEQPYKYGMAGIMDRPQLLRLCVSNRNPPYAINFSAVREDKKWRSLNTRKIVKAGEWVFLAGLYDSKTGEVRIYINGKLEATAAREKGIKLLRKKKVGLWFGVRDHATSYLNGVVDELKLYGRALSSGEIREAYEKATKIKDAKDE